MDVIASHLCFDLFRGKTKRYQITMFGLDAAGKTTLLFKLKFGKVLPTVPTFGFNDETIKYNNISLTVYDVGGQDVILPLWRHYFQRNQGIIFVVDSSDRERIYEARDALQRMLASAELHGLPLLVYANKQDSRNAMTTAEITDKLGLHGLQWNTWNIQASCVLSGEGVDEGLDWLSAKVSHQM